MVSWCKNGGYRSDPQETHNQSYAGSIGLTLTTNVSMTLCDWQIRHQTHVVCGCTTFGVEVNEVPN